MLFTFPGTIAANDLEAALAPFFALVTAKLEKVSGVQISLLGYRGEARCQIRGKDGRISEIVFEPGDDAPALGGIGSRVARAGPRICDRPNDDKPVRGLASLFGDDD